MAVSVTSDALGRSDDGILPTDPSTSRTTIRMNPAPASIRTKRRFPLFLCASVLLLATTAQSVASQAVADSATGRSRGLTAADAALDTLLDRHRHSPPPVSELVGARAIPAVARFDSVAMTHRTQLRDLTRSRGMQREIPHASHAELVAWLQERPRGTAILLYARQGDSLQTWVLDRLGIRAMAGAPIDPGRLSELIAAYKASLGVTAVQSARAPRNDRGLGVAPVPGAMPDSTAHDALVGILFPDSVRVALREVRKLIVVPALDIGTVPFAVLRPFSPDSMLIDQASVSLAASLADIVRGRADGDAFHGGSSALVVGDPAFADPEGWQLPQLPGARAEAEEVAAVLSTMGDPARLLLGEAATREQVESAAEDAPVLYLATHAVASATDPLDGSFIALAADRWTAREIQSLRLRSALAVLSACQTGLGGTHDAGVIGLARAFQLAGVQDVVMSLWSVDDAATRDLMTAFMRRYAPFASGVGEMLREAMLETRQRHPDPTKWAGFVVVGGG